MEDTKQKKKFIKKGVVVRSKEEKRIARRERDKLRKNKKKGRGQSSEEEFDFDSFQDSYEFGEEVHEPPTLNYKPKKLLLLLTMPLMLQMKLLMLLNKHKKLQIKLKMMLKY